MTVRALALASLAVLLAGILAFGSLAHAFLPHQHSSNEAVTSLLHSALHHESKKLLDAVPLAPLFSVVVVALIVLRSFIERAPHLVPHPALAPLRRGILPYRRFG